MFDFSLAYFENEVAVQDYDTIVKFTDVEFVIAKEFSAESPRIFVAHFRYAKDGTRTFRNRVIYHRSEDFTRFSPRCRRLDLHRK